MDVKAENLSFVNILSKGQYIVPDYQREYDWEDEEIDEFISDIEELDREEKYFIGHMVFEGDYNGFEFFVIDGQQRITTVTIMLCVIRDLLYALETLNSIKIADTMNSKYVFNTDKNGVLFPVLRNDMPYPILQAYVQSEPDKKNRNIKPHKSGEIKIVHAYDKFLKLFTGFTEAKLIEYRDKLFNLEIIFVAVKPSDETEKLTLTKSS